jgi:hypothetical protein
VQPVGGVEEYRMFKARRAVSIIKAVAKSAAIVFLVVSARGVESHVRAIYMGGFLLGAIHEHMRRMK